MYFYGLLNSFPGLLSVCKQQQRGLHTATSIHSEKRLKLKLR